MINSVLKWQASALLIIAIVFSGNYAYQHVFNNETKAIGSATSGKITAVTKIITAEQKQTYTRFIETNVKSNFWRFVTAGKIKGMLYFQWEAQNSYGIEITPNEPIEWKRTSTPGEIEIFSPPLKLIDSKILIDSDKYIVLDIDKELAISEKRIKSEYRDEQVKTTLSDARGVLTDESLINIAKSVIAEHIKQVLNQGLTDEKVHSAKVIFRS
jgi:hypothetical protein